MVERHRTGDTAGAINSEMDALSRNCSVEYDIATGYFSTSATSGIGGPSTCDSWLEYNIRPEAIALLREDGLCTDGEVNVQPAATWPDGALGWDAARDYIGSSVTLCGDIVNAITAYNSKGQPTFLDVGVAYPDTGGVTVVIWGQNIANLSADPVNAYSGKTVCVSGTPYAYEDYVQVEAWSPSQIEVVG